MRRVRLITTWSLVVVFLVVAVILFAQGSWTGVIPLAVAGLRIFAFTLRNNPRHR